MGEDEEDKIKNDDEEEEKVLADWVTTPAPKFGIKIRKLEKLKNRKNWSISDIFKTWRIELFYRNLLKLFSMFNCWILPVLSFYVYKI